MLLSITTQNQYEDRQLGPQSVTYTARYTLLDLINSILFDKAYLVTMKAPTHCCVQMKSYSNEDVEVGRSCPFEQCEIGCDTTTLADRPSGHLSKSPHDAISTRARAESIVRLVQTCRSVNAHSLACHLQAATVCTVAFSLSVLSWRMPDWSGAEKSSWVSFTAKADSTRFQRSADSATMREEMHRSQTLTKGP